MASPNDRRYLESHEWFKLDDDQIIVGISRFAVDELADITYIDVTDPAGAIANGKPFGEIESVKATSDLYSGIDGQIVTINEKVLDSPALINEDPWDSGWIIRVQPQDLGQLGKLLSAAEYDTKNA
jgi:glycine cleavage system H protein